MWGNVSMKNCDDSTDPILFQFIYLTSCSQMMGNEKGLLI